MHQMNMSKITRLQQSFRWQPHFPFMPVYLASHPWAEHYNFKYDTLPIVQVGPNVWSLEKNMKDSWQRHVEFFWVLTSVTAISIAHSPLKSKPGDISGTTIHDFFPLCPIFQCHLFQAQLDSPGAADVLSKQLAACWN